MTPPHDTQRRRAAQRLVLGLMSGTSADGIDVALVRIGARRKSRTARRHARLENFATLPFPADVRADVLRIAEGTRVSSGELSQLNFRLGQVFAEAAAARLPEIPRQPRAHRV